MFFLIKRYSRTVPGPNFAAYNRAPIETPVRGADGQFFTLGCF
jgi:hypothetical protein